MKYGSATCRALLSMLLLVFAGTAGAAGAATTPPDPLAFDPARFTTLHVTVDGLPMEVRRYHVIYVATPIRMAATQPVRAGQRPAGAVPPPGAAAAVSPAVPDPFSHQSMNIYVPQSAYDNTRTAIILQVNNSGWFASPVQEPITEGKAFAGSSDTDNTGAALKAGYVVINAGTRSRGIKAADDSWAGKAPAVVVDAKAAVRYLRHNDAAMPGSAERIVITGTSGGGGLSVAVAASGNSPDFYPFLAAIGAAGIDARGRSSLRDDVFATIAYCPINDLGHSDIAYEWQYGAVRSDANIVGGRYTPAMQSASAAQAAAFPAFLQSLRLKREDGTHLTAENLTDAILAQVTKGVEAGIARGEKIPAPGEEFVVSNRGSTVRHRNDWLTVENGHVSRIDYAAYLRFVSALTPLKAVTAFDAAANTGALAVGGESTLFGSPAVEYSNFTEYGWNHNEMRGDGSGADDTGKDWAAYLAGPGKALAQQLKLVSPLPYLDTSADAAPYWYVRHGLIDRDTSFATQVVLYHALRKDRSIRNVNFQLAWLQPHAGNYDVREAYAWLADVLLKAGRPPAR